MEKEIPEPVIKLAEALGGILLKRKDQVSDSDVIIAISLLHSINSGSPVILEFAFSEEVGRLKFKDEIVRSYLDQKVFDPWRVIEYLSQPAGDYFARFGSGGGSSGPSQPPMSESNRKQKDG